MNVDFENALIQEPVQAVMWLLMARLTDEQRKIVHEKLGRRVAPSLPADMQDEAQKEYPILDGQGKDEMRQFTYEFVRNCERAAYIKGYEKFAGVLAEKDKEIAELKTEAESLFKLLPKYYQKILNEAKPTQPI